MYSPEQQTIINQMTNWQNSQWKRAGAPVDIEKLNHFNNLKRTNPDEQQ